MTEPSQPTDPRPSPPELAARLATRLRQISDRELDRLLRDALADEARQLRTHPPADTLQAFHAGRLAEPDDRRIRDHLGRCAECSDFLLFLAAAPQRPSTAIASRLRAALDRLRRSLGGVPRLMPAAAPALATAASAAALVLAWQLHEARREIEGLTAPDPTAVLVDVTQGTARSPSEAGQPFVVPLGAEDRFFTLLFEAPRGYERYAVAVWDAEQELVWGQRGFASDEQGFVAIRFSRHVLELGRYDIEIAGLTEGGEGARASRTYAVTLVAAE